jgi:hypothetical protein
MPTLEAPSLSFPLKVKNPDHRLGHPGFFP